MFASACKKLMIRLKDLNKKKVFMILPIDPISNVRERQSEEKPLKKQKKPKDVKVLQAVVQAMSQEKGGLPLSTSIPRAAIDLLREWEEETARDKRKAKLQKAPQFKKKK